MIIKIITWFVGRSSYHKPRTTNHETRNTRNGFTIIEIIMAIVIVGVLAGVSSMYIKQVVNLWQYLNFRSESASVGKTALIRMSREIRQLDSVTTADANRLQFTDINGSVIDFQLSGSNLLRNSNTLSSDVQSLKFCYYDSASNPVCAPLCSCNVVSANLDDIYRIGIELTIQSGTQTKSLRTQVYPRNL